MKHQLYIRTIAGLILLLLFAAVSQAGPIRIAFRDTTIVGGTQFDYPIYVDSSVTGSDVSAYQVEFTFNNSIFTFISVRSEGSMSSGWGEPDYNIIAPGKIRIAGAGSVMLSGTGKLLIVRFAAAVFTYGNSGNFTFQSTLLNQGSPATSNDDGYVSVKPPSSITVSPNTWLITKGETKQFTVSGGKTPYTWSSLNPTAASINASGLLTAHSAGFTNIVCIDSAGISDTSGTVEVRSIEISIHDTSRYQGQWLDLPIYTTDATGLGITSGQFSISYNENLWIPDSFVTSGTLLSGWAMAPVSFGANKIKVSFASSAQLSGSGILLYIRMKASSVTYGSAIFDFVQPFFNESIFANSNGATVRVSQLIPINVTPTGIHKLVAGDSIQFSASSGTAPYTWTVSETSKASISSLGWLKAKKSGNVIVIAKDVNGATGNSDAVNIYDFKLSIPDTSLIPNDTLEIPFIVTPNMIGFSSLQFKITYTTGSFVQLIDVISSGTLLEGWSVDKLLSTGAATIAAAGVNSIFSGGTLLKLRFVVPDSTPRPSTITLSLSNVLFNQGVPLPLTDNGYFTVANGSLFGITPSSGMIQTIAVNKKDSMIFTVHNSGSAVLTSTIGITGSSEFSLSSQNISVSPSSNAIIKIYYLPINAGSDTATIIFNTNDQFHSHVEVTIVGTVLPFSAVYFNAASFNFGGVKIGKWKDTTVVITNSGTDILTISGITANSGVFTSRATAVNILPGNSFIDTLRFTPAAITTYYGWFLVTSNAASSPDTITVTGKGETPLKVGTTTDIPKQCMLIQNYPNPFNPSTIIAYSIPENEIVTIKVFDVLGKEAATLVNERKDAGEYSVSFNAQDLPSGIYFYQLRSGNFVGTKRMIYLK